MYKIKRLIKLFRNSNNSLLNGHGLKISKSGMFMKTYNVKF